MKHSSFLKISIIIYKTMVLNTVCFHRLYWFNTIQFKKNIRSILKTKPRYTFKGT